MGRFGLLAASLSLVAVALLGACGDDDDDAAMVDTGDHSAGMEDEHTDEGMADDMTFDREISIRASDLLRFDPDTIRVKAGERIRLVLDNEENSALHDFSVHMMAVHDVMMEGAEHGHDEGMSGMALHVAAEPGEHGALMFTADEPGEYEFFCSVTGHADAGMKGTIIVEA